MRSKWRSGQFGVELVEDSSEFIPRKYTAKVIDLRKHGILYVPVIGLTSFNRYESPSPWHVHHNCIELILCTSGTCLYESEGKSYRLKPGLMFVSREDERHRQLDCPKGYAMQYLHFSAVPNPMIKWFEKKLRELPRMFACDRKMTRQFGKIFCLAESERPAEELKIRLQIEVLVLLMAILDSANTSARKSTSDSVDEIAKRMNENPTGNYPLEDLAAECGMSKASFISVFKAAHGNTPHAFLLFSRIEMAKNLLRNGFAMSEIVDRVGFSSTRVLARTFKNFVGVTPSEWQKRKGT